MKTVALRLHSVALPFIAAHRTFSKIAQSENLVILQFLPFTARCGALECIKNSKGKKQQTQLRNMRMYISYVIDLVNLGQGKGGKNSFQAELGFVRVD